MATAILNEKNCVKRQAIKAKESIALYKLGDGYTLRASWHDKEIMLSGKDRELLTTVADNLFKIRDAKRIEKNIYEKGK